MLHDIKYTPNFPHFIATMQKEYIHNESNKLSQLDNRKLFSFKDSCLPRLLEQS